MTEERLQQQDSCAEIAMQDAQSKSLEAGLNASAGQMLKKARTDAGLHIAALAVSLHVPVKRIEALENDQLDQLPDLVFARALTSSICQTLKTDPNPILDKLPKVTLPRLNRDDIAINTPIGDSSTRKVPILLDIFSSPLILGVILLGLASAAIFFWPKSSVVFPLEISLPTRVQPEISSSQVKDAAAANDGSIASNLTITSSLDQANISANAGPASSASVGDALAATSAQSASIATIDNNLVMFKATGETWVEVKNASGMTVFSKLLKSGESDGAKGALPLTVTVGRADVTQVEVRGKPFDLSAVAKSNVAKFEVN